MKLPISCGFRKIRSKLNMSNDLPLTSRSLPIALLRARERVMRPIREMLADAGLTEQQWRVLRVLKEEGPQEPTCIAERACLLLPSLTRILQKLEAKGLIRRRPHRGDKRRQVIQITAKGEKIIHDNIETTVRISKGIKAQLGADRHEQLLDLLNELTDLES